MHVELLTVEGVRKSFRALVAVRDVSLEIHSGEILGLIGPNGSGKTTLLNMIAGTYKPERGKIFFQGRRIDGRRPDQICRAGVARTYQQVKPFLNETVHENLLLAALHCEDSGGSEERVARSLSVTALESMEGVQVAALPLIHRKCVELARALTTGCKLMLLDEPMAGLNPTEVSQFSEIIRKINSIGVAVLLIEHVMKAIMALSNRIVVLDHGEKITEGKPSELANDPKLARVYMGTE